jgi:hypothetical protein
LQAGSLGEIGFGKTVTIEYSKKDKYRRTIGKILINGDLLCRSRIVCEGRRVTEKEIDSGTLRRPSLRRPCLEGIDLSALPIKPFDGRAR